MTGVQTCALPISEVNKMDPTPFLEIDLENYKENQIEEVKKFHKSYFNIETILSSASELKFTSDFKNVLIKEFSNPSPEFVRLIAKQTYDGIITPKLLEQFTELLKKSVNNYFNDKISERLNIAIQNADKNDNNTETEKIQDVINEALSVKSRIDTTSEELEGFYIIKSILRNKISADRITHRDSITYFAINIDDNNRKPICRLYFNNLNNMQLAFIGDDKKEIKNKLNSLDDLYSFSETFEEVLEKYK